MSQSTDRFGFTEGFDAEIDTEITAFDIIDELGEGLDLMWGATQTRWKAYFTRRAYDLVREDPDGYFYFKNGIEYVKVFENDVIPFLIDMRVAGIDDTISQTAPYSFGCRREVDED